MFCLGIELAWYQQIYSWPLSFNSSLPRHLGQHPLCALNVPTQHTVRKKNPSLLSLSVSLLSLRPLCLPSHLPFPLPFYFWLGSRNIFCSLLPSKLVIGSVQFPTMSTVLSSFSSNCCLLNMFKFLFPSTVVSTILQ